MLVFVLCLFMGCFVAFLSGLFGIGGGLIIVPALVLIYSQLHIVNPDQIMHLSIGTSLASSIVPLIFSIKAHHQRKSVRWEVVKQWAPGLIVGAMLIGPAIVLLMSSQYLKILFGLFCFIIAAEMIFGSKKENNREKLPGKIGMALCGLFTGFLSSMLGIAGGAITGAILNHFKMDLLKAIGTAAAISLVLATSGSIGLMFAGYHQPGLPVWSTGFIYWPALLGIVLLSPIATPLGVTFAHKLPIHILKKSFAVLLVVIGTKMIL